MYPYIDLFGLEINTYFLILSVVFTSFVYIITYRAHLLELSSLKALDVYMYGILGAFLGSRLFYVLYQEPVYFADNPLEILAVWRGGFVFFGGLIGGLVAAALYLRHKNESLSLWLDFSAPLLSLGYGMGRIACLFAGCCYGKETTSAFSIYLHEAYRHPTQIYASLWGFLTFGLLITLEKKQGFHSKKGLPLFSVWMILHGLGRILMEVYRADPRGDFIQGLSVSTWISLLLIAGGGVSLSLHSLKRKKT